MHRVRVPTGVCRGLHSLPAAQKAGGNRSSGYLYVMNYVECQPGHVKKRANRDVSTMLLRPIL